MRIFITIAAVSFLVLSLAGCRKTQRPTAEQNEQLVARFEAANDSVQRAWQEMIAEDDAKHGLMRRLLQEITYTNNYDKARWQELSDDVDQLQASRYQQQSLSNIDAYDSMTFAVTDELIAFARSHPRYEDHPLMAELIGEINSKNNMIIIHRVRYDDQVRQYNTLIAEQEEHLQNAMNRRDIAPMPIFQLPD
jgi:hypothetical protein